MSERIDTVIIGGGHAGLTMSYFLSQLGREHVILERGRVGERWRSERWDSFHFQFPNWTIELPGYKYQCDDPEAFAPGREVVRFIEDYAAFIKAPTRCGVEVTSEVLVFLEVDGDGFARVGDEEHKIESQTSVVVPPGTIHAFGLRDGRVLKSISILPDADAVPGHRLLEKGEESFEMPDLKKK